MRDYEMCLLPALVLLGIIMWGIFFAVAGPDLTSWVASGKFTPETERSLATKEEMAR